MVKNPELLGEVCLSLVKATKEGDLHMPSTSIIIEEEDADALLQHILAGLPLDALWVNGEIAYGELGVTGRLLTGQKTVLTLCELLDNPKYASYWPMLYIQTVLYFSVNVSEEQEAKLIEYFARGTR